MQGKNRLVGLDLLKIISALMIVALHYLGYSSNLMIAKAESRALFITSNFLEAFFICGVNVFVIITCYVNVKKCDKAAISGIKRATSVWTQTILITIPMAILLLAIGASHFAIKDVLNCILPFSTKAYWFVSVFICFSLLLPFLNRSVENMSARSLLYLSCTLTLIFSVIPTFFEIFGWVEVQHGYSLSWFTTLYYDTAFLTKCKSFKKVPSYVHFIVYVLASLTIFASVVAIEKIGGPLNGNENYIIRNYASLPVFIQSFSLFFTFKNFDLQKEKLKSVISTLAQASLVCYIIHMHPLLKQFYVSFDISRFYPTSVFLFIAFCFIVSAVVFLISGGVYHLSKAPVQTLSRFILKAIEKLLRKFESIS